MGAVETPSDGNSGLDKAELTRFFTLLRPLYKRYFTMRTYGLEHVPDRVEDRAWATAAEARCAQALSEIALLPTAASAPDPATRADDLDEWEDYFSSIEQEYVPRRIRPDGAFQIYVADPDGHHIELFTGP